MIIIKYVILKIEKEVIGLLQISLSHSYITYRIRDNKMNRIISLLIVTSIGVTGLLFSTDSAEAGSDGVPGRRRGGGTRYTTSQVMITPLITLSTFTL